MMALLL